MNQINLDINKSGQIINEPVVLRVGEEDQTITVNLLKDGQPYTSFTTATFFANKPSGAIVANDPANISSGTITYTVPQALVNEFGKITNAYFLIDGKVSTESFVIAVLQGVNISDDLNDYIPGMSNLNVIYDKWKDKLQAITDELAGIDAPKEVKNVIDNELKNYTDQINELQRRITALKTQLDALEVPVNAVGTNLLKSTGISSTSTTTIWSTLFDSSQVYDPGIKSLSGVSAMTFSFDVYIPSNAEVGSTVPIQLKGQNSQATDVAHDDWNTIVSYPGYVINQNDLGKTIRVSDSVQKGPNYQSFDTALADTASITIRQSSGMSGFVYSKIKFEKGSVATDYSLNPSEIATNDNVQTTITNALSDVKTQIQDSAVGTNLLMNTGDLSVDWDLGQGVTVDTSKKPAVLHYPMTTLTSSSMALVASQQLNDGLLQPSTTYTASFHAKGTGTVSFYCFPNVSADGSDNHTSIKLTSTDKLYTITFTTNPNVSGDKSFLLRQDYSSSETDQNTVEAYIYGFKLEKGSVATDYSLNPSDIATNDSVQTAITNALGKVDVGKTITATDDTGKTVNLKITGIS